jgi:hypothetical protein
MPSSSFSTSLTLFCMITIIDLIVLYSHFFLLKEILVKFKNHSATKFSIKLWGVINFGVRSDFEVVPKNPLSQVPHFSDRFCALHRQNLYLASDKAAFRYVSIFDSMVSLIKPSTCCIQPSISWICGTCTPFSSEVALNLPVIALKL